MATGLAAVIYSFRTHLEQSSILGASYLSEIFITETDLKQFKQSLPN